MHVVGDVLEDAVGLRADSALGCVCVVRHAACTEVMREGEWLAWTKRGAGEGRLDEGHSGSGGGVEAGEGGSCTQRAG